MDKVLIVCTANKMTAEATLVTKTKDFLKVHLPGSDSVIHLTWNRNEYLGKSAGLEFSSTGKVIK